MNRTEAGFVAGAEALIFGVLIFVVGSLIFANAWSAIDAKYAVSAAARESARAYSEANDPSLAQGAAQTAEAATLSGYHRNPSNATMTIDNPSYERCSPVSVTVSYPVKFSLVPILSSKLTQIVVTAHFSDVVDAYRSGLPGDASC